MYVEASVWHKFGRPGPAVTKAANVCAQEEEVVTHVDEDLLLFVRQILVTGS